MNLANATLMFIYDTWFSTCDLNLKSNQSMAGVPRAHSTCPHLWLFSHSHSFSPGYFFFLMHGDKRLGCGKGKEVFYFLLITLQSPTLKSSMLRDTEKQELAYSVIPSQSVSVFIELSAVEFLGPGSRELCWVLRETQKLG